MYVLVVDDEPMMRELYLTIFDWAKNGFELVGVAHDGAKALEIMRSTKVDVVITDIKMPVMDGLELIRTAKDEFKNTKFVVMSGYNDYSLVREAFKLGAEDYYLKSEMDPEHVMGILCKIKAESQHTADVAKDSTQKPAVGTGRYSTILTEKIIKELIWGSRPQAIAEQLHKNGIFLDTESLTIMVLGLVDYYTVENSEWGNERETFKYAVNNVLCEICGKYGNVYSVCNLPNEYLILLSSDERIDMQGLFEEIKSAMQQCFHIVCNCGYCRRTPSHKNLEALYRRAKLACDYCFVSGNGKMVDYSVIEYKGREQDYLSRIKELRSALSHDKKDNLTYVIPKLRVSSDMVTYKQISDVKNFFEMCYLELVRLADDNALSEKVKDNVNKFSKLKDSADLSGYNKWLSESITILTEALSNTGKIHKAKQYIREHYNETLTLHTVAEHIGISEGHLSRLFQQTEGYGFSQFLIMTRMSEAKKLLATTNLKIYEVAQMVGYPNVGQFNRMFKKTEGISPKAFIK